MSRTLTRRAIIGGGAALGSLTIISRTGFAADFKFRQFHNQALSSPLHKRLVEMWAAVKTETNGRVETEVFAENAGIQGSDPAALKMVISGELDFFTLMGGILGQAVPVAEVQQVPFAFKMEGDADAAADGDRRLSARETAAKGLHGFPVMAFDNGMRQTSTTNRPIVNPADFAGIRIRLPAGQMFTDTFRALGAQPVTINVNQIYDGLKDGKVNGSGKSAGRHGGVQALRGAETHGHDQPHVVGLQPDGQSRAVAEAAGRYPGRDRAQCHEIRAPAARRPGCIQRRPAQDADRARHAVQ